MEGHDQAGTRSGGPSMPPTRLAHGEGRLVVDELHLGHLTLRRDLRPATAPSTVVDLPLAQLLAAAIVELEAERDALAALVDRQARAVLALDTDL